MRNTLSLVAPILTSIIIININFQRKKGKCVSEWNTLDRAKEERNFMQFKGIIVLLLLKTDGSTPAPGACGVEYKS